MPLAVEQFDLSGFDLVISSSYAVAKGVITGPDQLHVSYVHSPVRFAWDLQHQYLAQAGMTRGLRPRWCARMLHHLRMWDSRTANGVDHFIANSSFIARRIWKVYRRPAQVIHPPVDLRGFRLAQDKGDAYVTVSRLVPYKRVDLLVAGLRAHARRPPRGRRRRAGLDRLRRMAPPNVELRRLPAGGRLRAVHRAGTRLRLRRGGGFRDRPWWRRRPAARPSSPTARAVPRRSSATSTSPAHRRAVRTSSRPKSLVAAIERFEHDAGSDHARRRAAATRSGSGMRAFCAEFARCRGGAAGGAPPRPPIALPPRRAGVAAGQRRPLGACPLAGHRGLDAGTHIDRGCAAGASVRATLTTTGTNVLVLALNLGTGLLTARFLGPEGRGEFAAMVLWPQFLASLLTLGLPQATTFNIVRHPEDQQAGHRRPACSSLVLGLVAIGAGLRGDPGLDRPLRSGRGPVRPGDDAVRAADPVHVVGERAASRRTAPSPLNGNLYLQPALTLAALGVLAASRPLHAVHRGARDHAGPAAGVSRPTSPGCGAISARAWSSRCATPPLLLRYGLRSCGIQLLGALSQQFDRVFVLGVLSPAAMGLYVVARSAAQADPAVRERPEHGAVPQGERASTGGRRRR